ncbi:MAG: Peptidoglycan-binding domain 1 protein [Candidatus Moranbacteria bacterium GW2011_GWE1_35_17]|nr:MAG: Peptidoglycan-binding domain 1 protein [Candidatus Moranbacteria bacterium GW2011_GWE1_35_17]KKP81734.1 MAG: Peptidoglycan-binding domain 1 protein [Candidatus Moranbacteria bacterium GW2011_GWF2_35_54]
MKSNKKTIFSTLIFSTFVFCFPAITFAYEGLVPCGGSGATDTPTTPCNLCHLFEGIQNLINWGEIVLVTIAVVAIVAGAIMYIISAGDSGMMESAKGVIKQALWGVVIVLGAWVIVNTALWLLTSKIYKGGSGDAKLGISNWYDFQCGSGGTSVGGDDIYPDTPINNDPDDTGSPATPGGEECPYGYKEDMTGCLDKPADSDDEDVEEPLPLDPDSFQSMTEAQRRAYFKDRGITVSETKPGATEVDKLKPTTVEGVLDFKNEVGAPITLNSGSEAGPHNNSNPNALSHANGYKVDIDNTPVVNNYIEKNYTRPEGPAGTRKDGAALYYDSKGNQYAKESSHWDVTYYPG